MNYNLTYWVKAIFTGVLLYCLWRVTYFLYAHHYQDIIDIISAQLPLDTNADILKQNKMLRIFFSILKGFIVLLDLICVRRAYLNLIEKKRQEVSGKSAFMVVGDSLKENLEGFKKLPHDIKYGLLAILVLQLIAFTFLIVKLPYNYDEIYTYNHFSGRGIIASLTDYHVPNNHILHNVISTFFLSFPIDELVGIRLISYLAGFVSTIYFFKLASEILPLRIAVVITALLVFSYPFVYYSIQARGYGLLILFSILTTYAFFKLLSKDNTRKYMALYTVISIAGFYTVPSFLYFFIVINVLLFIHVLIHFNLKKFAGFVLSNLIIGGTTALLYMPIVIFNSSKALTENNGVIQRDTEYINNNLKEHLYQVRDFFAGSSAIGPGWIFMLLGAALIFVFHKKYNVRFAATTIITLLLSPVIIMYLHQTIPFPRTWSYLMIPICLSIGLLLHLILSGGQYLLKNRSITTLSTSITFAVVFVISGIMLARFSRKFEEAQYIDRVVKRYVELLDAKISGANTYTNTYTPGGDMSFYLAEAIAFEKLRRTNHEQPLKFGMLSSWEDNPLYDVIILDKKYPDHRIEYDKYDRVMYENDFFIVHTRKGL